MWCHTRDIANLQITLWEWNQTTFLSKLHVSHIVQASEDEIYPERINVESEMQKFQQLQTTPRWPLAKISWWVYRVRPIWIWTLALGKVIMYPKEKQLSSLTSRNAFVKKILLHLTTFLFCVTKMGEMS